MKYSRFHCVFLTFALFLAFMIITSSSWASATKITIERFVYDGQASDDGDEYVKICNISGGSIDLGGANPWRIGDEESATSGGSSSEGMYELQGTLNDGDCFIIALNANAFLATWSFAPDYEMDPVIGSTWSDNTSVPNLTIVFGNWQLTNTQSTGDNITLWEYSGGSYTLHDSAAYGTNSDRYTEVSLDSSTGDQISCSGNAAVTRNAVATDTDNMASDFNCADNPTAVTLLSLTAYSGSARIRPPAKPLFALSLVAVGIGLLTYRRRPH